MACLVAVQPAPFFEVAAGVHDAAAAPAGAPAGQADPMTRDELKVTAAWLGLVGCCMVVWAGLATLLAWWVF